ncbi:MAG TPA: hypothetical protein VEV17_17735 [Bryobacteraceae bacterium]|nr:hypothetical protein [Bryobacteraceae bacterium]
MSGVTLVSFQLPAAASAPSFGIYFEPAFYFVVDGWYSPAFTIAVQH